MKTICLLSFGAAVSAFAPIAKNAPIAGQGTSLGFGFPMKGVVPTTPAPAAQSTLPLHIFGSSKSDEEEEILKAARSARKAAPDDRVVEIRKPLGIVLEDDEKGNVYVKEIEEGSNAALSGKIFVGDQLTMCSATFGNELWSTRGVGLDRVMGTIRIRAGPVITLVFENEKEKKTKVQKAKMSQAQKDKIAAEEKKKNDILLEELNADDEKLKKKRFLGLF